MLIKNLKRTAEDPESDLDQTLKVLIGDFEVEILDLEHIWRKQSDLLEWRRLTLLELQEHSEQRSFF